MLFNENELLNLDYLKNLHARFNLLSEKFDEFMGQSDVLYTPSTEFNEFQNRMKFSFRNLNELVIDLDRLCVMHSIDLSLESSKFSSEIDSVLNNDDLNIIRILSSFIYSYKSFFDLVQKKPFEQDLKTLITRNNAIRVNMSKLLEYFKEVYPYGGVRDSEDLKKDVEDLNTKLNKLEELLRINFENESKVFKRKCEEIIQKFNDDLVVSRLEFKINVEDQASDLKGKISSVDNDFKNTVKDYETLKKFINAKGEVEVTDHYRKKAITESRTYWAMTILTFGIIIFSISLALKGLNEYKEKSDISIDKMLVKYKDQPVEKIEKINNAVQQSALTYLILRLVFSLLLFSTIIYTSRVAYRAYIHMRHSENMMLKLATLRPFINQLDEAERNQIHKDLVPDYFGKDAGMVDGVNEKFKDLPANVSAVAMKAIEQIGSGGGSSEGKNDKKEEA